MKIIRLSINILKKIWPSIKIFIKAIAPIL